MPLLAGITAGFFNNLRMNLVVDIYSKDGKQSNLESDPVPENSEPEDKKVQSPQNGRQNEPNGEDGPGKESADEVNSDTSKLDDIEDSRSEDEIEFLKQKIADLEENILREKAENQNTRKRLQKEIAVARDSGIERFVREFLPVKDSLDMGLANIDSATELESLKTGIELTIKMVDDFLDKLEISKIDPKDELFNPEEHQAMSVEITDKKPPNTVLKVFQTGYKLRNRLVRPAMVVVSAKDKN